MLTSLVLYLKKNIPDATTPAVQEVGGVTKALISVEG